MRRLSYLFGLFLLLLFHPSVSAGQAWSGILSTARAVDWSGAGIPGGAPDASWTQCGSTVAAGSSAATIQSAINSCGTNHYVLLAAGTYNLSTGLNLQSNMVLRGAGPSATSLVFSNSTSCNGWGAAICIAGSNTYGASDGSCGGCTTANWTAGYSQGTTVITLSSVAGIVTNLTPIVLDQCNDGYTGSSGSGTCTGSPSDTGNIFVCDLDPYCASEGPATGYGRGERGEEQVVMATAITGTGPYNVTISDPIRLPNWGGTGKYPQAWWGSSTIQNAGVESLTISWTANNTHGVVLATGIDLWAKNIESLVANDFHVMNYITMHDVVRDSYFYETLNDGTQSYGIGGSVDSDLLLENNIIQGVTDPVNWDASCSGCVAGYNYAFNQHYTQSLPYMMGMVSFHGPGTDDILLEGNVGDQPDSDDIHGSHEVNTFFRNYFNGFEPNGSTTTSVNTEPIHLGAFSRYYNIVGNVLGTLTYHTAYQCAAPNATTSPCASQFLDVYDLGYSGNTHGEIAINSSPDDPKVWATLTRWGNWDAVSYNASGSSHHGTRYCTGSGAGSSGADAYNTPCTASETASSDPTFPGLANPSTTLPASFYLSAKPSWFGSVPFPAIGPDVTGGNIANTGGHANEIPAQVCYNNTAKNSSGFLTAFDANACYASNSSSTPPSPPASLAPPQIM